MKNPFVLIGLTCLLIIIHVLLLKSTTFTAWPEMFSYPYLINNGFLIYKDIAHPYVPLLSFTLAIYYKMFGISLVSHQIFTWGLILINDLLIFFIARKLLKINFVLVPVIIYVVLQPIFEGNMLWFDLATTPCILSALIAFLYIKKENKKFFWFGFFLALALLVKQQSIVLIGLILLILFLSKETRRYLINFIIGVMIPVTLIFVILLVQGIFKDYIFWTLEFPIIWLPKFPGYSNMPGLKNTLMLLFLFGLPIIYLARNFLKISVLERLILVSLVAAVVMAFPRFSLFHLQPALAVLIIFYILIIKEFKKIGIFFLLIAVFYGVVLWKDYRPFMGIETARFFDNEEQDLASFIKANSSKGDSVYFLGSHSILYILSDRLPPKPWIENFVWHFEIPRMQEKQIAGFNNEKNLVIFKQGPLNGNWYDLGTYQPKKIENYISDNFVMVNKNENGIEVWKRKK